MDVDAAGRPLQAQANLRAGDSLCTAADWLLDSVAGCSTGCITAPAGNTNALAFDLHSSAQAAVASAALGVGAELDIPADIDLDDLNWDNFLEAEGMQPDVAGNAAAHEVPLGTGVSPHSSAGGCTAPATCGSPRPTAIPTGAPALILAAQQGPAAPAAAAAARPDTLDPHPGYHHQQSSSTIVTAQRCRAHPTLLSSPRVQPPNPDHSRVLERQPPLLYSSGSSCGPAVALAPINLPPLQRYPTSSLPKGAKASGQTGVEAMAAAGSEGSPQPLVPASTLTSSIQTAAAAAAAAAAAVSAIGLHAGEGGATGGPGEDSDSLLSSKGSQTTSAGTALCPAAAAAAATGAAASAAADAGDDPLPVTSPKQPCADDTGGLAHRPSLPLLPPQGGAAAQPPTLPLLPQLTAPAAPAGMPQLLCMQPSAPPPPPPPQFTPAASPAAAAATAMAPQASGCLLPGRASFSSTCASSFPTPASSAAQSSLDGAPSMAATALGGSSFHHHQHTLSQDSHHGQQYARGGFLTQPQISLPCLPAAHSQPTPELLPPTRSSPLQPGPPHATSALAPMNSQPLQPASSQQPQQLQPSPLPPPLTARQLAKAAAAVAAAATLGLPPPDLVALGLLPPGHRFHFPATPASGSGASRPTAATSTATTKSATSSGRATMAPRQPPHMPMPMPVPSMAAHLPAAAGRSHSGSLQLGTCGSVFGAPGAAALAAAVGASPPRHTSPVPTTSADMPLPMPMPRALPPPLPMPMPVRQSSARRLAAPAESSSPPPQQLPMRRYHSTSLSAIATAAGWPSAAHHPYQRPASATATNAAGAAATAAGCMATTRRTASGAVVDVEVMAAWHSGRPASGGSAGRGGCAPYAGEAASGQAAGDECQQGDDDAGWDLRAHGMVEDVAGPPATLGGVAGYDNSYDSGNGNVGGGRASCPVLPGGRHAGAGAVITTGFPDRPPLGLGMSAFGSDQVWASRRRNFSAGGAAGDAASGGEADGNEDEAAGGEELDELLQSLKSSDFDFEDPGLQGGNIEAAQAAGQDVAGYAACHGATAAGPSSGRLAEDPRRSMAAATGVGDCACAAADTHMAEAQQGRTCAPPTHARHSSNGGSQSQHQQPQQAAPSRFSGGGGGSQGTYDGTNAAGSATANGDTQLLQALLNVRSSCGGCESGMPRRTWSLPEVVQAPSDMDICTGGADAAMAAATTAASRAGGRAGGGKAAGPVDVLRASRGGARPSGGGASLHAFYSLQPEAMAAGLEGVAMSSLDAHASLQHPGALQLSTGGGAHSPATAAAATPAPMPATSYCSLPYTQQHQPAPQQQRQPQPHVQHYGAGPSRSSSAMSYLDNHQQQPCQRLHSLLQTHQPQSQPQPQHQHPHGASVAAAVATCHGGAAAHFSAPGYPPPHSYSPPHQLPYQPPPPSQQQQQQPAASCTCADCYRATAAAAAATAVAAAAAAAAAMSGSAASYHNHHNQHHHSYRQHAHVIIGQQAPQHPQDSSAAVPAGGGASSGHQHYAVAQGYGQYAPSYYPGGCGSLAHAPQQLHQHGHQHGYQQQLLPQHRAPSPPHGFPHSAHGLQPPPPPGPCTLPCCYPPRPAAPAAAGWAVAVEHQHHQIPGSSYGNASAQHPCTHYPHGNTAPVCGSDYAPSASVRMLPLPPQQQQQQQQQQGQSQYASAHAGAATAGVYGAPPPGPGAGGAFPTLSDADGNGGANAGGMRGNASALAGHSSGAYAMAGAYTHCSRTGQPLMLPPGTSYGTTSY